MPKIKVNSYKKLSFNQIAQILNLKNRQTAKKIYTNAMVKIEMMFKKNAIDEESIEIIKDKE